MSALTVTKKETSQRFDVRVLAAFFAIYVIWGSTFLAIRITVVLIPPWFSAGVRFFAAGVILYAFCRLRGAKSPSWREWRSLAILGVLMFALTYGALFWGEQYVTSGVTSVLEATLPLITVLLEVFVLRHQRFRWRVLLAVIVGFCGVAVMVLKSGGQAIPVYPCLVILAGSIAWSLGSVLTRSLPLPKSRPLTAGAEMMLGGGMLLVLSAVSGELHPFPVVPPKALFALIYLISRWIAAGVHRLRLVARPHARQPSGEPCLREPGCGARARILRRGRRVHGADHDRCCASNRERVPDDARKEQLSTDTVSS